MRATAVQRLKAAVVPAADAWVSAIDKAADKGDHKPAKDLLMHTGTIEPLDSDGHARGSMVLVAIKIDGRDVMKGDDGVVYDIDPETGDVIGLPKTDGPVVMIGGPCAKVNLGIAQRSGKE